MGTSWADTITETMVFGNYVLNHLSNVRLCSYITLRFLVLIYLNFK